VAGLISGAQAIYDMCQTKQHWKPVGALLFVLADLGMSLSDLAVLRALQLDQEALEKLSHESVTLLGSRPDDPGFN
jgi:hypothetical protein